MKANKNTPDKKRKKPRVSILFKSIAGMVLLVIVFSILVSIMGFYSFTDALLEQYAEGALRTAETAAAALDDVGIEAYARSGGVTEAYRHALKEMSRLCNSSGSTFIYVIRPDLSDYGHITFLFSTVNENSSYTCFTFGYVRETTNDEYKEKYRRFFEGISDRELVIRDKGYIETDPHITAMVPLKDKDGNTSAILCVQRQMDKLVDVRNTYIGKVLSIMIGLMILVIIAQAVYLHRVVLRPVRQITDEASRFAAGSHRTKSKNRQETEPSPAFSSDDHTGTGSLPEIITSDKKLADTIKTHDEIGLLAMSIDQMEESIIRYISDLTKATAEKERISTELSLATRIQADMLPSTFPAFPDRPDFDIYATMDPAKEVGGDFYDFFLVDDDHLCVVVADVSDKGIPAALFMMASKIILANNALSGKTPAQILTDTNAAICANNSEEMFVTVWLGILELSTGKLTAANAGHEYPVLKQSDGGFALYKDKHGFVIGGLNGMKYKEYEIQLTPGSKLFLYTDGVPEAKDRSGALFGTERMLEALNEAPGAAPDDILKNVRKAVDGFVREAEQFDDQTMLCLEYKGKEDGMSTL